MDSELRQLVETYKPNDQVIKGVSQIRLLATVGPTATGKTTIMKALAASQEDVHFVVGETSRAPRQGEQPGADMIFRSMDDMLKDLRAGELVEAVTGPNGDLYSTRLQSFPTDKLNVFPFVPLAIKQFRTLPFKFFETAFIVPASFELWQQWLDKQAEVSGWDSEKIRGRLAEALESFEFSLNDKAMHFVLNDQVDKAAERLYQIAQGHAPDDEELARQTAEQNFVKLQAVYEQR